MWMDWGNDYFTFSDTNIEYIWRFLKEVHAPRLAVQGPPLDPVVPPLRHVALEARAGRRGELQASIEHPSLEVRFPLHGREGQSLVVWTTTPWTLPANVAAAVKPDAEYGRRGDGDWVAVARYPEEHFVEKVRGEELVGLRYEGPFDHLPAQEGVEHRVIPWDEVSLDEGTGIVHIAPGCGAEDFELSREFDLPVLMPIDESGRMLPGYGDLEGLTDRGGAVPGDRVAARAGAAGLGRVDRAPLSRLLALLHPARLPRRRRLVHLRAGDPAADAGRATRRSNGRLRSTRSGWTTGCGTWATGTSRAAATSGFRCRSIPASAATST